MDPLYADFSRSQSGVVIVRRDTDSVQYHLKPNQCIKISLNLFKHIHSLVLAKADDMGFPHLG